MALNGKYTFPRFNVEIENPTLSVISKKYRFDNNMTSVEISLEIPGGKFGVIIESTNAQGGSQALPAITNWVESYLDQYHKVPSQ